MFMASSLPAKPVVESAESSVYSLISLSDTRIVRTLIYSSSDVKLLSSITSLQLSKLDLDLESRF